MTNLPDPDFQPQFYDGVPGKRLLAWIIDTILILLFCVITVILTAFVGAFVWPILVVSISFVYRTLTLASGSATWGMRFAGVEIRAADGAELDLLQAALHTLGYMISMALPIVQIVSIILMLTGARKQGLTDLVLGTVALNRRAVLHV
ncbi:RDD family protein [Pontibaca salina]|uniref:RDD family protein n=1 Tax=Pontibaca salina TaxID=2795731 RepID=A0A934HR92_9RHOB|nr:RDD family protein [Pontibaca salina]MBI6629992.1 RDD family protein [Pontibaca salina]